MQIRTRTVLFYCTLMASLGQAALAQSYDTHEVKMLQWHLERDGKPPVASCAVGERVNYGRDSYGDFTANFGHCAAEMKWCAGSDRPIARLWSQPAFQRCTEELWSSVRQQNWDKIPRLAQRFRNGGFEKRESTPRAPDVGLVRDYSEKPASRSTAGLDQIDGSNIEMLEIDEKPDGPEPEKYCECFGDDGVMFNGFCTNEGNPDSPFYGSRDENGKLKGPLYPKGRYEWTAGCKATVGGRVNFQELRNNGNNR